MTLRVLDLFAGLGGLSRGFKDRGHQVITLDYEAKFGCDLTMDICEFAKDPQRYLNEVAVAKGWIRAGEDWIPGVILGGPPCEAFTVLTIGRNWHPAPTHAPKTDKARLAVRLVQAFLDVVAWCNEKRASLGLPPPWWWMENPRAKLRAIPIMKGHRRATVSYCQYGSRMMKPTDLWGVWPASWVAKPMCSNNSPCQVRAPRGSRTGIQGDGVAKDYGTTEWAPGKFCDNLHPGQTVGGRRIRPDGTRGYGTLRNGTNALHPERIQGDTTTANLPKNGPSISALRAEVPVALSLSLCLACEDPTPARSTLDAFHGAVA